MKRAIGTLLAAVVTAIGTPATAETRCAELFAAMGRTYLAGAEPSVPALPARETILDCPAGQLMQFAFDFAAARDAKAAASADQLIGTWVSDDILGIVTGLFIPIYEIIEIAPGAADGEVTIVQKILRYGDPAETWFSDDYEMPPVDVIAAGRVATYGEHVAVLAGPARLEPRCVRYHDFPLEGDRYTGLAMKLRMASFLQTRPITVRTDGQRLVFELFDRLSPGGSRVMTFRRHDATSPDRALKMIVLAEIPARHFHCLMESVEKPRKGFIEALDGVSVEEFSRALETAWALGLQAQDLRSKMLSEPTEPELEVLREMNLELMEANMALFKNGALKSLAAASDTPFGCPSLR